MFTRNTLQKLNNYMKSGFNFTEENWLYQLKYNQRPQ